MPHQETLNQRLRQGAILPDALVVAAALAAGADPAAEDFEGHHALSRAAWRGGLECCQLILQAAPELATRPHGATLCNPIHLACALSDLDCARYLAPSSDLTQPDALGRCPMLVAVHHADARPLHATLAIVDSIASELRARAQPSEAMVQLALCLGSLLSASPTARSSDCAHLVQALRLRLRAALELSIIDAAALAQDAERSGTNRL